MNSTIQHLGIGVLCACIAGCAGPQVVAKGPISGVDQPLQVSLLTEATTPGRIGTSYVLPNAKLHSGDQVAFKLEVTRPAHVYLVWYSPDGWSLVLFPQNGDLELAPGASARVPGEGKWIPLDSHVGEENIYVLASYRPLSESDPMLLQKLHIPISKESMDRGEAPPPQQQPKEPTSERGSPDVRDPKDRGPDELAIAADHKVSTKAGKDGLALLRLSFQHLP